MNKLILTLVGVALVISTTVCAQEQQGVPLPDDATYVRFIDQCCGTLNIGDEHPGTLVTMESGSWPCEIWTATEVLSGTFRVEAKEGVYRLYRINPNGTSEMLTDLEDFVVRSVSRTKSTGTESSSL